MILKTIVYDSDSPFLEKKKKKKKKVKKINAF